MAGIHSRYLFLMGQTRVMQRAVYRHNLARNMGSGFFVFVLICADFGLGEVSFEKGSLALSPPLLAHSWSAMTREYALRNSPANKSEYDLRSSNNRREPLCPEPREVAVAKRCVIDYIETEFVYFSSYQYESATNGFLAFSRLNWQNII